MTRGSPPAVSSSVRSPRRSLVSRLVVSFLAPVLAILVLVALLAYLRSVRALEDSVVARLEAVAEVRQIALAAWIDRLSEDTELLARLPAVRAASAELLREVETAAAAAYRDLAAALHEVAEARPSVSELMILSAAGGRVLLSTRPENEGGYRTYDLFYTEGRLRPFIQNVYASAADLSPTLTVSAPLADPEGTTLGVLAAHHSLDYLDRSTLGSAGVGPSGRVTLVDRHGLPVTGRHYGTHRGGLRPRSDGIDQVVLGNSGHGSYEDPNGRHVIGVYRWLDRQELGLLVEVDRDAALSPARQLAVAVASVGLALVPLLAAGIYLVARRIAAPIQGLAQASRRVAGGDLRGRAEVTSSDEIGVLAANFNEMVAHLEDLYEDMAHKIDSLERNEDERERLIDELEAKNAELERFTYTVSHDLKSPLVTIRGYVGMIERDLEEGNKERIRGDLLRVSEAAKTMAELLAQLLELSRVGRLVGPPEEIELGQLAAEAIESVRGRQRQLGAEITIRDDLPRVRGDRTRLREVLENLLDNALKFMGGQVDPRVELGVRRSRDGEEVVYVRDNGIGIEPGYHEKVFGLFDRLDPGVEGTGIGLALVRRIVETHGGRIWVESAGRGLGSCFCLTLPAAPQRGTAA